jgi:hypothetical protein
LANSKNKHYIQKGEADVVEPYSTVVVPAGRPIGTSTGFDFSPKNLKEFEESEKVPLTVLDAVVHELRHQYDYDIGNAEDKSTDGPSAKDPMEIRAVNNENRARKIEKTKKRTTYSKEKIDPKKLQNPPNNIVPKDENPK